MAVTALLAAACGTDDDSATPDPTAAPVAATAAQVDAEPSPAPTPTPEPTLYVHSSGLACYGDRSTGWHYNFVPDLVVGFPSVDEAASHWWQNESEGRWWHSRDGTPDISAEDLTQHASEDNTVAFRDSEGNAQVLAYAIQLPDGSWVIEGGTACAYFDGSNPKSGGTWG